MILLLSTSLFRRNILFLLFLISHSSLYSVCFPRIVKILGTTAGCVISYVAGCELFILKSAQLYKKEILKQDTIRPFSEEDQHKIESIQTIDELRKNIFSRGHLPFYKHKHIMNCYNAQPFITQNTPPDASELIRTYSKVLEVKVDQIASLSDIMPVFLELKTPIEHISYLTEFVAVAGEIPSFLPSSFILVNTDKWEEASFEEKTKIIIHELAHLKLRHTQRIGINSRIKELQAETYFALYGSYQEAITDIFLSSLEPYKEDNLSANPNHPSSKEIYTILTHAKKLRAQEKAKQKK